MRHSVISINKKEKQAVRFDGNCPQSQALGLAAAIHMSEGVYTVVTRGKQLGNFVEEFGECPGGFKNS